MIKIVRLIFASPLGIVAVFLSVIGATLWAVWPSAQEQERLRRVEAVLFARQCLAEGRAATACYQGCDSTPNVRACRSVAIAGGESRRGR